MPNEPLNWHRFFGLILMDFFTDSPFIVELEKDLSVKKQLLDVVILRKKEGAFNERLPDGLDNLTQHNLITFKSYQETLDDWSLKELIGHYVNYRKQVSPTMQELLPEDQFRLYAVSARFPQNLAQQVEFTEIQTGVYDCLWGTDVIRIIVLRQLPQSENNAPLHLFSASVEQVRYGAEHYRMHSDETSTLLQRLYNNYSLEGLKMSYTMQDFRNDYVMEHLKDLPLEKIREKISPEEFLKGLSPEVVVQGMSAEELQALSKVIESRLKQHPAK